MFTHMTEIFAFIVSITVGVSVFLFTLIKRIERKSRKEAERDVLAKQLKELQNEWEQSKRVEYETNKKTDADINTELKRDWMRK